MSGPTVSMLPSRVTLLLTLLACSAGLMLVAAPAQAATERARISWNKPNDIDLHVYDDAGNHAYYGDKTAIPDAVLSPDDVNSGGPETFTDNRQPSTRRFRFEICYFAETASGTGPTQVTFSGPGLGSGTRTLSSEGECQEIGTSGGDDADADGVLDGNDNCPSDANPDQRDSDGDGKGDACDPNQPPVAVPDSWRVAAGHAIDGNVLENDSDPDGDPITARVLSISFASREWSRMDDDGGFLYTAGPGTRVQQRKVITYVAVDSKGATSQPTTAVVTVTPRRRVRFTPRARRAPRRPSRRPGRRGRARSSATSYWTGPYGGYAWACFGSGLNSQCFYMLSVSRTAELNRSTGWFGSIDSAATACFKYGFIPLKNKDCAKELAENSFGAFANKTVIRNAAKFGNCLLYRVARKRTFWHPRAGEWGKPEYHTLNSLTSPFNGNARFTGYGRWAKGFSGKWRVPLYCNGDGRVWVKVNEPLREAP